MKLVSAILSSTLIEWARPSGEESPIDVPLATVPGFSMAPVRARIASSRLVLPLANGPTIAIDRGPVLRPLSLILPPLPARSGSSKAPIAAREEAERQFQPSRRLQA